MFNIAIDGPGGAGKSSVSKLIAKKLGIIYVDTGALYRAVALHMTRRGIRTEDSAAVVRELPNVKLSLRFTDRQVLLLGGEEVGDAIRTPEMSMGASRVSAIPEVRDFLLETQRRIAKKNSVIMDGRDIGTVILPNAELKVFLFAGEEARARRRYDELIAKGKDVSFDDVLSEMRERDKNDSTRSVAPCVPAPDAILLDNSELTLEETADKIISYLDDAVARKKADRFYMRAHRLIAPIIRFLFGLRVEGKENIPTDGGYVVCSNHIAVRDPVLIAAVFPRPVHFIAKKELFSVPVLRTVIRALGAIGVDRTGNDVGAMRTSVDIVKRGDALAIFPQGHRCPGVNPTTTPLKNGAALIAYHSKGNVLPVCIKTKKNKYAPFRKITIAFGEPFAYEELGFVNGGYEEYRAVTDKIFSRVVALGDFSALPSADEKR